MSNTQDAIDELTMREQRAQEGIIQFAEEMQAIRDGKLYPNAGKTDAWKTYCRERWAMSKQAIDQTIRALPVLARFKETGGFPTVTAAAAVATLPEKVQDAILKDRPKRDEAKARAKTVRRLVRKARNEGREATEQEQITAARSKPKKPKIRRLSEVPEDKALRVLQEALSSVHEFNRLAADIVFSDTGQDRAVGLKKELEADLERTLDLVMNVDNAIDKMLKGAE